MNLKTLRAALRNICMEMAKLLNQRTSRQTSPEIFQESTLPPNCPSEERSPPARSSFSGKDSDANLTDTDSDQSSRCSLSIEERAPITSLSPIEFSAAQITPNNVSSKETKTLPQRNQGENQVIRDQLTELAPPTQPFKRVEAGPVKHWGPEKLRDYLSPHDKPEGSKAERRKKAARKPIFYDGKPALRDYEASANIVDRSNRDEDLKDSKQDLAAGANEKLHSADRSLAPKERSSSTGEQVYISNERKNHVAKALAQTLPKKTTRKSSRRNTQRKEQPCERRRSLSPFRHREVSLLESRGNERYLDPPGWAELLTPAGLERVVQPRGLENTQDDPFERLFVHSVYYVHEIEESFLSRATIKISLPDHLKSLLVDDWEYVTKNLQLVPLPSSQPVNKVLDTYFEEEKGKRRLGSPEADLLEEVVMGLKDYFVMCLGRILLYRFERQQYYEQTKKMEQAEGEYAELKNVGDVYGPEHLCRLFVSLPELIAQTNMDAQAVKKFKDELTGLTNWMAKNSRRFFVQKYEQASADYCELAKGQ